MSDPALRKAIWEIDEELQELKKNDTLIQYMEVTNKQLKLFFDEICSLQDRVSELEKKQEEE
jgi:hypothetical protein